MVPLSHNFRNLYQSVVCWIATGIGTALAASVALGLELVHTSPPKPVSEGVCESFIMLNLFPVPPLQALQRGPLGRHLALQSVACLGGSDSSIFSPAAGKGVAPFEEHSQRRSGQFSRRKCRTERSLCESTGVRLASVAACPLVPRCEYPIDVPLNQDGSVLSRMSVRCPSQQKSSKE